MDAFFHTLHCLLPFLVLTLVFTKGRCSWVTLAIFGVLVVLVVCLSLAWPQYPDQINTALGLSGGVLIVLCDPKFPRVWW